MLDTYIATLLDPPLGYYHFRYSLHVRACISYLCLYSPIMCAYPCILLNGNIEPGHASVLESISQENQSYFESYFRDARREWLDMVKICREILARMG